MTTIEPKISIVMPVYNGQAHVREAIESIQKQTFGDFEFLIMDDGSTDDTAKILEAYAQKDHRIKIFSQKNSGIVKSLNELVAHAKTNYIARMDADDLAYPQRLEVQYNYMKKHPDTVVLGTFAKIIESLKENESPKAAAGAENAGLYAGGGTQNSRKNTAFQEDILNRWYLSIIPPFIHSGVVFEKKAFHLAGCYRQEEYPAEDYGLWVRMKHFGKLNTAPELLMEYHLNNNGISAQNYKKQIAKRDELNFKNLEDLYKNDEIPAVSEVKKLLQPYHLAGRQKQVLAKLACLTGCFYIQKNNYSKAAGYFKLCLQMDFRRFDAAFNLILGKFKKAFLVSVDKYPGRDKFLLKIYFFPQR